MSQLNLRGQDRIIDSLKLALKTAKHDTTRCGVGILLGEEIYGSQPDSAIRLWEKVCTIAESNLKKNDPFKKKYLICLANAWNDIGYVLTNRGDFKKGLEYFEKSADIREVIGDKLELAGSLNNIGVIYYEQGNNEKALEYYTRSLKSRMEIKDTFGIANSFNNIGNVYDRFGDITKALEYFEKSLKLYEKTSSKGHIASALLNLALTYQNQGDLQQALEYNNRCLIILQGTGSKKEEATTLNNIGNVYRLKKDFLKAKEYYEKSSKIREELGFKDRLAETYNNLAVVTEALGDNAISMDYYKRSLKISEGLNDKYNMTSVMNNLASNLIDHGRLSEASKYAERSMRLAKELGYPARIENAAYTLKRLFKKQNKFKEAFEMFELEIKMHDSIKNAAIQKATLKNQMQYAYEKKEAVADAKHKGELKKQQELADEKQRKQNIIIWSVVIGLILVIVFAAYVVKTLRVARKQKLIIEIKSREVEEKQKEILDSIHYAKRIQTALVPSEKYIDKSLKRLKKN